MNNFRTYLLIIGFTISTLTNAQIGERRDALAIGVNAGMTWNSVSFDPTIKQKQLMAPTFGITFRATSEKYFATVCAFQIELNYARLGWKEDIMSSQNQPLPDTYERRLDYIEMPLLARLGWGREEKGMMGYLLAGPQLGYCFGEKEVYGASWTLNEAGDPDRSNGMFAQYGLSIDKKFDYGITAGLGGELNTHAGHFMLDARYYYGLSDLFKNGKKDVFGRSNHGTILVKFTYLFDIKK